MIKNILTFWVVIISTLSTYSQSSLQIGDGTISYYAPIDIRYDKTYCQTIYLGSEINGAGTITAISWYYNNKFESPANQKTEIYIGHTSKNSFQYVQNSGMSADWEPINNSTKVFSGRFVTNGTKGWKTIILDTPFKYDGYSNLVITTNASNSQFMIYDSQNQEHRNWFYNTLFEGTRTLTRQTNGGAPFDPNNPGTYASPSGNAPNIIFEGLQQSCETPKGLKVSEITNNSAVISWDIPNDIPEKGTDYYISTSPTLPDENTIPNGSVTSGETLNAIGLNDATYYYVWIRNNCGNGNVSSWSVGIRFITICNPVTGFYENCEGDLIDVGNFRQLPKCWSRILRGGSDLAENASVALLIDKSGTIMNGKNSFVLANGHSNTSVLSKADIILITPKLASLNLNNYRLKFLTRTVSGVTFQIGTITSTDPLTAVFTPFTSVTLPKDEPKTEHTINLTGLTGNHEYLAFRVASKETLNGFFMDDVKLEPIPECKDISNIKVTTTSPNSATVIWQDQYLTGKYQVAYNIATNSNPNEAILLESTNSLTQVINNLNVQSDYQVWIRSICNGSRYGEWIGPIQFSTPCNEISSINENFDNVVVNSLPNCWGNITRGEPSSNFAWVTTKSVSSGGSAFSKPNAIQFYAGTTTSLSDLILFTPRLELSTLTSGTHRLVFYTQSTYENTEGSTLEVGTLNSNTVNAVFTKYSDILLTEKMTKYVIDFNSYSGSDNYIAFRLNRVNYSNIGLVYIDDVKWELIPTCNEVVDVLSYAITPDKASITWTPTGSETNWQVVYSSNLNADPDSLNLKDVNSEITTILTDLNDNTIYKVWIRAKCDANDYSYWSDPITFQTKCLPIATFDENFQNVTVPNLPQCWGKILRGETLTYIAKVETYKWENNPTEYGVQISNGSSGLEDDIILVSPNLSTLNLGTYRLRIIGNGANPFGIQIGTLSNNDESASFNLIETIYTIKNKKEYIIDFSGYSGSDTYIGIRTVNEDYAWFGINNIIWEPIPFCPEINNLKVLETTNTSAIISWDTSTALRWEVVYSSNLSEDPNNLTPISVEVPSVELVNLTDNKKYNVWVRSICSDNLKSNWNNPVTIKTQCIATNVPYIQDFETAVIPNLPDCTSEINVGVSNKTWVTAKAEEWEMNYGFTSKTLKYTQDALNSANTWFFTQGINLIEGENYIISYRYGGASTDPYFVNDLKIMYGTSAAPNAMILPLADHKQFALSTPVAVEIPFTAPKNDVYYFGFNAYSKRNSFYIFVDDIKIDSVLDNNKFNSLNNLKYYPNPVKNTFTISSEINISDIKVYNILGQMVIEKSLNDNLIHLDMSSLSKGTYLVKIKSNEMVDIIKVVKE